MGYEAFYQYYNEIVKDFGEEKLPAISKVKVTTVQEDYETFDYPHYIIDVDATYDEDSGYVFKLKQVSVIVGKFENIWQICGAYIDYAGDN